MKLNLEDDGVFCQEISRETAREYLAQADFDFANILENLLDEAQGYTGIYNKPSFIVIEVKP